MDLRIEAEILLIAEKRGYTIINKRYRSSTGFKIVPRKEVSKPEKEWIKKSKQETFRYPCSRTRTQLPITIVI